ncbi:MAG: hypothetical protein QOI41_4183 [Myxococcales bacterium]|nr:hypothetical protein [Myxococcales bacterium]
MLVASFASVASLAHDARADDLESARKDFAEGVRLYQRGDYEGARRLFKKADAEHHAAPILYNLARTEERLLRPQSAVDAYEAYVAEAGESGELTGAAVVAITQIKARSTRLRIETKPSGARIFVDGSPLAESAPTTFLVGAGHHVVVAQGEGFRAERDVEVQGNGDSLGVTLEGPVTDASAPPALAPSPTSTTKEPVVPAPSPSDARALPVAPAPPPPAPDGFVWGAAFTVAPYHLLGAASGQPNAEPKTQVLAGAILEAGHAVTERFEFLARGFLALGPDGKPSYAIMGGPGLSLRIGSSVWLGATFLGGQIETVAQGTRYGTDVVFGTMLEATFVVLATSAGQWTVGAQPGLLLTDKPADNTAFFFPLSFGYRAY